MLINSHVTVIQSADNLHSRNLKTSSRVNAESRPLTPRFGKKIYRGSGAMMSQKLI